MTSLIYLSIFLVILSIIIYQYPEILPLKYLSYPLLNVSSYKLNTNQLDSVYDWEYIKSDKGVDVYVKQVRGSKLLAFRGVATLDMHISDVLIPFSNLTLSYQWIEMLKLIESYDINNNNKNKFNSKQYNINDYFSSRNEDIVHQILQLPWPISPRELLLHRQWIFDEIAKSVTFNYKSIDDDIIPYKKGMIRAISPHTVWKFTAVNQLDNKNKSTTSIQKKFQWLNKIKIFIDKQINKIKDKTNNNHLFNQFINNNRTNYNNNQRKSTHTLVEIECLVDSKGGIPSWFMNYVQKSWPPKAIESFTKLAKKQIGLGTPIVKLRNW